MSQLDRVTQQNAALVEESAAAAESLNQQAGRLVEAVSAFRLANRFPRRPPGRPAPFESAAHRPIKA